MFDFPTHQLTVSAGEAIASLCPQCHLAIAESEVRVSSAGRAAVHLQCFQPKYPVAIHEQSEVRLCLPAPQLTEWRAWLTRWNAQYQPLPAAAVLDISQQRVVPQSAFRRELAEAFKFLSPTDVCRAGAVSKCWHAVCWSVDLWTSLGSRDFSSFPRPICSRADFVAAYFQACLSCSRTHCDVKIVCPRTKRVVCRQCFQLPECTVLRAEEYQQLLGVGQDYLAAAQVPLRDYQGQSWVYTHEADPLVADYRSHRRSELLSALKAVSACKSEDALALAHWNFSKGRYLGAVLLRRKQGERGLMQLLRKVYCGSSADIAICLRKTRKLI